MKIFDVDIEGIKPTWLRRVVLILLTPTSIVAVVLIFVFYLYWKSIFYDVWKGRITKTK